jgi:hypothetical protein
MYAADAEPFDIHSLRFHLFPFNSEGVIISSLGLITVSRRQKSIEFSDHSYSLMIALAYLRYDARPVAE